MRHQLTTDSYLNLRSHKLDELTVEKLSKTYNKILALTEKVDAIAVFIQNDTVRVNTILALKTILEPALKNNFRIFESRDFPSLEQSSQLLDKNFLVIQRFVTIKGLQRDLHVIHKNVANKKMMANLIPYFYAGEPIPEPKVRSLLVKLGSIGVQTVVFDNIATFVQESVELIISSIQDILENKNQDHLREVEEKKRKKIQIDKLLTRGSEMLLRAKRESDQQENLRLYQDAERCFSEAIELMGKHDVEGYVRRGDAFFAQQKYSLAMNDYREAVHQRSESVEVHAKCGVTLYKMAEGYLLEGNITTARELYLKGKGMINAAEELAAKPSKLQDPGSFAGTPSPIPGVLSAILEIESVDLSKINEDVVSDLADLKKSVIKKMPDPGEENTGDLEINLTHADVNLQLNNLKDAKTVLEKIYAEAPYLVVPVYNKLASAYRQKGSYEQAIHIYLDILKHEHEIKEEASIVTINFFLALTHYGKKIDTLLLEEKKLPLDRECGLIKILDHLTAVDFMTFEEASIKYQGVNKQKLPELPFKTLSKKNDFINRHGKVSLENLPSLGDKAKKNPELVEASLDSFLRLTQLIEDDKYALFTEKDKEISVLKQAIILSIIAGLPKLKTKLGISDPEAEALSALARITVMKPKLQIEKLLDKHEIKKVQLLLSALIKRTSSLLDDSLGTGKKG